VYIRYGQKDRQTDNNHDISSTVT